MHNTVRQQRQLTFTHEPHKFGICLTSWNCQRLLLHSIIPAYIEISIKLAVCLLLKSIRHTLLEYLIADSNVFLLLLILIAHLITHPRVIRTHCHKLTNRNGLRHMTGNIVDSKCKMHSSNFKLVLPEKGIKVHTTLTRLE